MSNITAQKEILSQYLPKMLSIDEIKQIIDTLEDKSVPAVMKHFKLNYAGKVNMADVSKAMKQFIVNNNHEKNRGYFFVF